MYLSHFFPFYNSFRRVDKWHRHARNINVIFRSTTKWDCLIILNLAESQNFQKFAIFSQVNVLYYELITFNWASTCVPCIKTSRFPFIDDSRVHLASKKKKDGFLDRLFENLFSFLEGTWTWSSFDNRTPTPYFWLQPIGHQISHKVWPIKRLA